MNYTLALETSEMFLEFMIANNIQRIGTDFRNKSGQYGFKENPDIPEFNVHDFETAMGAFADGYNRKPRRRPFAHSSAQMEIVNTAKDLEVMIDTERVLKGLVRLGYNEVSGDMPSKNVKRDLHIQRLKIYTNQYVLGTTSGSSQRSFSIR